MSLNGELDELDALLTNLQEEDDAPVETGPGPSSTTADLGELDDIMSSLDEDGDYSSAPEPSSAPSADISEVDDILDSLTIEESPAPSPAPAPSSSFSIDLDIDLTPDYPAPSPAPAPAAEYTAARSGETRGSMYGTDFGPPSSYGSGSKPSYASSTPSYSSSSAGSSSLNALESDLLREINRLRSSPIDYANILNRERKPYYEGTTLKLRRDGVQIHYSTHEGVHACNDAISHLQRTSPMSGVTLARGMTMAAKETMSSMASSGSTSLSDGQLVAGLARHGTFEGQATQLAGFGHDNAQDILMNFLISDGDSSRRYRNILLDPKYKFVGISAGTHNSDFKHMCLLQFVTTKWTDK